MKTKQLIESGIIHCGEPRHYRNWDMPGLPKLRLDSGFSSQILYRRQKAFAPQMERTPRMMERLSRHLACARLEAMVRRKHHTPFSARVTSGERQRARDID